MGSVRIPASYCGVVGFKPSSLICPNNDLILLSHTYDTIGFMSNKVSNINNIFNLFNSLKNTKKINKIKCIVPIQALEDGISPDVLEDFQITISKLKKNNVSIEIKTEDVWLPNIHRKTLLKIVEYEGARNLKKLVDNDKSKISNNLRENLLFGKNINEKKNKKT